MNERDELFERCAAARTLIDRTGMNAETAADMEVDAFMAIFHPDHPTHNDEAHYGRGRNRQRRKS